MIVPEVVIAAFVIIGLLLLWRGHECCRRADDPMEDDAGLFIMALGAIFLVFAVVMALAYVIFCIFTGVPIL